MWVILSGRFSSEPGKAFESSTEGLGSRWPPPPVAGSPKHTVFFLPFSSEFIVMSQSRRLAHARRYYSIFTVKREIRSRLSSCVFPENCTILLALQCL